MLRFGWWLQLPNVLVAAVFPLAARSLAAVPPGNSNCNPSFCGNSMSDHYHHRLLLLVAKAPKYKFNTLTKALYVAFICCPSFISSDCTAELFSVVLHTNMYLRLHLLSPQATCAMYVATLDVAIVLIYIYVCLIASHLIMDSSSVITVVLWCGDCFLNVSLIWLQLYVTTSLESCIGAFHY